MKEITIGLIPLIRDSSTEQKKKNAFTVSKTLSDTLLNISLRSFTFSIIFYYDG